VKPDSWFGGDCLPGARQRRIKGGMEGRKPDSYPERALGPIEEECLVVRGHKTVKWNKCDVDGSLGQKNVS